MMYSMSGLIFECSRYIIFWNTRSTYKVISLVYHVHDVYHQKCLGSD